MAREIPDHVVLERHRDFKGRKLEASLPRLGLLAFCVIPVLALFNLFGQTPKTKSAANPNGAATLDLRAPESVRGGLLFEARFDIHAKREIKDAVLVLSPGWLESMTVNTIEPGAGKEASKDGSLALDLGDIPAGKTWRQYVQFQVNPVNLGKQAQTVSLFDGNVPLLTLKRTMTVWP